MGVHTSDRRTVEPVRLAGAGVHTSDRPTVEPVRLAGGGGCILAIDLQWNPSD